MGRAARRTMLGFTLLLVLAAVLGSLALVVHPLSGERIFPE